MGESRNISSTLICTLVCPLTCSMEGIVAWQPLSLMPRPRRMGLLMFLPLVMLTLPLMVLLLLLALPPLLESSALMRLSGRGTAWPITRPMGPMAEMDEELLLLLVLWPPTCSKLLFKQLRDSACCTSSLNFSLMSGATDFSVGIYLVFI